MENILEDGDVSAFSMSFISIRLRKDAMVDMGVTLSKKKLQKREKTEKDMLVKKKQANSNIVVFRALRDARRGDSRMWPYYLLVPQLSTSRRYQNMEAIEAGCAIVKRN